jgi:trk system potassium uptake protein TrkH
MVGSVEGRGYLPRTIQHPARLVPLAFIVTILFGTGLLMLPISRADPGGAPFVTALFTSTSAVCVTGLAVQDTATYWSGFGQGIILLLSQIGGLGIMTGATLLALLVTRQLRLSNRLVAQAETRSLALGNVASLVRLIFLVTISVELAAAAILTLRLRYAYQEPWDQALWNGFFHAVSAFNNAGFSTMAISGGLLVST